MLLAAGWLAGVGCLQAVRSQLEVVTAEAGDTWVYGCSSDPRKMALMRLFMRARRAHGAEEEPLALFNFSRLLIKASEHTWGTDGRCMVREPTQGIRHFLDIIQQ